MKTLFPNRRWIDFGGRDLEKSQGLPQTSFQRGVQGRLRLVRILNRVFALLVADFANMVVPASP
jgi:hypothetical protein